MPGLGHTVGTSLQHAYSGLVAHSVAARYGGLQVNVLAVGRKVLHVLEHKVFRPEVVDHAKEGSHQGVLER
jgi:hypothetical protein